jgi:hypothetical protein
MVAISRNLTLLLQEDEMTHPSRRGRANRRKAKLKAKRRRQRARAVKA